MSTTNYLNVMSPEGEVLGSCGHRDAVKALAILQTAGVVCDKAIKVLDTSEEVWMAMQPTKPPTVEAVVKGMRNASKRGLNFYQWRRTLLVPPRLYSDQEMQLKYERLEEVYKGKAEEQKGQWILLNINKVVDRKQGKMLLFDSKIEAGQKGCELYGRGNFFIEDFLKYRRTSDFKQVQRFFAIKARLHTFKK